MSLPFSLQLEDPEDKNGNSWGYVTQHGILEQYQPIGIDTRGLSIFEDQFGSRQQALLDNNGSFNHGYLREGGWYHSDNPYEHIVRTAEDYGKWYWVEEEFVEEILERGIGNIQPAEKQGISPSAEARSRWESRGNPEKDVMDAWEEAKKINWPRKGDNADARYHYGTGCTILKNRDCLITVYPEPSRMNEKWLAEEILSQI